MKNTISAIIPSFNRAHTLNRSLDSVVKQTLAPDEIILIDDGSTDQTAELVARQYPQVTYLHQSNQGVSRARNFGVAQSQTEWLAFLDSDDEWFPEKLELQMTALVNQEDYSLCHTDEIWIRNGKRVNPMNKHVKTGGLIFENCLPLCAISPSSVVMKRSLFEQVGGFDETLPACEDYDLWLRICATEPVMYLQQPLLRKYGGHADQLSSKHWGMDRFRVVALEKVLQSGNLNQQQATAATNTLLAKCEILANGALKRGNIERAAFYASKFAVYAGYSMESTCP